MCCAAPRRHDWISTDVLKDLARHWRWLWSRCPGIGPARVAALDAVAVSNHISLEILWSWPRDRLERHLRWPRSLWNQLDQYRTHWGPNPIVHVPDDVLLQGDCDWPDPLNALTPPPSCLFHRGDRSLLRCLKTRQAIAVIGTRSASAHALQMADRLGRALALAGWPVLSGLADGIDAAAHRGCLATDGAPVAVLGTHLDRVYPAHHHALQSAVGRSGLLLSERHPGDSLRPGHFAARNRLIVALASALVIVECPEKSGALISARYADALQCPVWVMPADAGRWSARGSNALLQEKARPLVSIDAFLQQLGLGPLGGKGRATSHQPPPMDKALLQALSEGMTVDMLQQRLGRPAASLALELVQLELRGLVVCEPGQRWRAV